MSKKLQTTVTLPAQLTPYEQVDIYPKVTGFVQTVTVDRGSRVRRGQLLVRLTAPEIGQAHIRQRNLSSHGCGLKDARCSCRE
jgi:membrane fusion protein (multidrug efflux system)